MIYCYYPEMKTKEPQISQDNGWRCFYTGDQQITMDAAMADETGKSRKNIVVGEFNILSAVTWLTRFSMRGTRVR